MPYLINYLGTIFYLLLSFPGNSLSTSAFFIGKVTKSRNDVDPGAYITYANVGAIYGNGFDALKVKKSS